MRALLRPYPWRLVLGMLLFVTVAAAGPITLFTSASAFPANDAVAWIPTANNHLFSQPLTTTSSGGIAVTGGLAGPAAVNVELPCFDGTIGSNFAPCAHLLDNNGYGALTLTFSAPIAGLGAQFDDGGLLGPFTAELDAYNGSTLLGTVSEAGNANRNADNSAIFLGFTSPAPVTSVVLNTSNNSFEIGQLSLDTLPLDPVPEAPTGALAGGALVLLCGLYLRRRLQT